MLLPVSFYFNPSTRLDMSKTSDYLLLAAGTGDNIFLFEMINNSLAILTFVEKHPDLENPFSLQPKS